MLKPYAVILVALAMAVGKTALMGDTIRLADYAVECSEDGLSIGHEPSGDIVLQQGRFHASVDRITASEAALMITLNTGDSLLIRPRTGTAFLEFKWTLAAPDDSARTLENLKLLTFISAVARGDGAMPATVGTGGICKPGDGSYMFLVSADAKTRRGLVISWLTSERGSGVILTPKAGAITARMDYGHHSLAAGETERTDSLLVGWFGDTLRGLESYADEIAKHHDVKLPLQRSVYCTWYHGGASNEKQFARTTDYAVTELQAFGLDVLQIDDGWQLGVRQNGPKKDFTAHDPKGPYPSGMMKTADRVAAAGMIPGIWWMPFAGTAADPHYADKQDFFVRDVAGQPREVKWGGTCLDMTNPEALAYTRENARRIAKDWHYKYFKLDGLWTGIAPKILYVNDAFTEDDYGKQDRFDDTITPVEAYRLGMKAVRDGAGDDVFILGCNLAQNMRTMGASYGLFDAMRVGPDNNAKNWESLVRGVFNSANRYFLHGRVWYNDPDPHYVREIVPISRARTLSSWVAITGFLNTSSEQYDELPAERLELLRRTLPAHGLKVRPVDYLERPVARIWKISDDRASPARHAIGFFNWDVENREAIKIDRSLAECDLHDGRTYVGFDFWRKEFLPEIRDQIQVDLAYNECRIWCLREKTNRPMVVSTSRHVTQGIVDIVEEKWDAGNRVLSGQSRVVADDPYELRVWTPDGYEHVEFSCSEGAHIHLGEQSEHGFRLQIDSSNNTTILWKIRFRQTEG